jgi:hypothetical protein
MLTKEAIELVREAEDEAELPVPPLFTREGA